MPLLWIILLLLIVFGVAGGIALHPLVYLLILLAIVLFLFRAAGGTGL